MQAWTHLEYFSVSDLEPSPWSQLPTHSMVLLAWALLGEGTWRDRVSYTSWRDVILYLQ